MMDRGQETRDKGQGTRDRRRGIRDGRQGLGFLYLYLCLYLFIPGCKSKLPIEDDISNSHFALLNEDSVKVVFPDYLKGRVTVMGFIFTNCPDICPLTTNNMERIQKELESEDIKDVSFVSISFDPARDKPSVLKQYAEVRGIETDDWHFLTGDQSIIDSIKKKTHFFAVAADTSYDENRKPYYFFVHTDRISLLDKEGRVRKNYKGSTINIEEIVKDIKELR